MIIAYDNYKGSNSTAVYSFFKSIGHKNIKMLMGGFKGIVALDPAAQEYARLKKELKEAQKPLKLIKKVEKYRKKLAKAKKKGDKEAITKNSAKLVKAEKKAKHLVDFKQVTVDANAKIKTIQAKMDEVSQNLLVVKSRKLTSDEKKLSDHDQIALLEKDEGVKHTHYKIDETDTSSVAGKADVVAAMNDIKKNKTASKYMIIDARSKDEISGKTKPEGVVRGGHIPGATFLEWTEIMDEKRKITLKDPAKLTEILNAKGITKDKTIYTYCQVGAGRGSHIATTLEAMGYENVKVYTGSWDEWNHDKSLPLEKTVLK
jgi:thiosulfate/3-mercaptopyruvate sulfurtransferase